MIIGSLYYTTLPVAMFSYGISFWYYRRSTDHRKSERLSTMAKADLRALSLPGFLLFSSVLGADYFYLIGDV